MGNFHATPNNNPIRTFKRNVGDEQNAAVRGFIDILMQLYIAMKKDTSFSDTLSDCLNMLVEQGVLKRASLTKDTIDLQHSAQDGDVVCIKLNQTRLDTLAAIGRFVFPCTLHPKHIDNPNWRDDPSAIEQQDDALTMGFSLAEGVRQVYGPVDLYCLFPLMYYMYAIAEWQNDIAEVIDDSDETNHCSIKTINMLQNVECIPLFVYMYNQFTDSPVVEPPWLPMSTKMLQFYDIHVLLLNHVPVVMGITQTTPTAVALLHLVAALHTGYAQAVLDHIKSRTQTRINTTQWDKFYQNNGFIQHENGCAYWEPDEYLPPPTIPSQPSIVQSDIVSRLTGVNHLPDPYPLNMPPAVPVRQIRLYRGHR